MFRSVWFANMDCVVDNIRYLQDDDYKYQQPSEPYQPNQPYKSEQCGLTKHTKYYDDIGYRTGTTANCNRTISELEHDIINIRLNDSIKCNTEFYTKLSK